MMMLTKYLKDENALVELAENFGFGWIYNLLWK